MADLARADELVRTIDQDETFRADIEQAPTMAAKRSILEAHGFSDIDLDDMRAYVESKGGTIVMPPTNRELTEQELGAIAGGLTNEDAGILIGVGGGLLIGGGAAAAAAA